jgi:hypothetical protein
VLAIASEGGVKVARTQATEVRELLDQVDSDNCGPARGSESVVSLRRQGRSTASSIQNLEAIDFRGQLPQRAVLTLARMLALDRLRGGLHGTESVWLVPVRPRAASIP